MSLTAKIVSIIALLFIFAWGVGAGFLTYQFVGKTKERFVRFEGTDPNVNSEGERYFSDEIILQGKESDFTAYISTSRRETATGFSHYYKLEIRRDGVSVYSKTDGFQSDSSNILEDGSLFTTFENVLAEDISARESYKIDLSEINFSLNLPELTSDFVVKNRPEYTKYVALGDGVVNYGNEEIQVHAYLSKIYSVDSSKYIFFDGISSLNVENYQLIFWDDAGNFYLVDSSDVENPSPYYTSHKWLLYKDASNDSLIKRFSFDGELTQANKSWDLEFKNILDERIVLKSRGDKFENTDFEQLEGDGFRGSYAYYLL